MGKSYKYAVIEGPGMHGSGDTVHVACLTDMLDTARKQATKLTLEYRHKMAPYGASSGFYRVVLWESGDRSVEWGWAADDMPSL